MPAARTGFEGNPFTSENVIYKIGGIVAAILIAAVLSMWCFETLDASEVMCVQSPVGGKLTWHTSPGVKWQGFGKLTKYYKLETYDFNIPVRFNDGGHGTVVGSINFEMPLSNEALTPLHVKYGSQEAIEKQLVQTVVNKCIYMTGPLMSSKESYAEKRTSLIFYIEDQIVRGVYKTLQKEVKTTDPVTGAEKTVTVVDIVQNKDGNAARQEEAILTGYGIKTSNFAVIELKYDEAVDNQIKQQQAINMDVQTAMAAAKKAEQNAITVAKEGEANAARAKWEQEVIKAKEVTKAQQNFEVATLDAKAAEQMKRKEILLGEGESTRKRLVMQADGALNPKLEAYVQVMTAAWENIGKYQGNWVPTYVTGGSGNGTNGAMQMMEMIGIKAARDLGIDVGVRGGGNTK
jgi:hypothetical protein